MKDIRINFWGGNSTIALTEEVEGKNLYEQKALVNIVTEQGSDTLYPDRGTTMLRDSIQGKVFSYSGATHVGNFAALDTLFFITGNEYEDVKDSDTENLITDMDVIIKDYNNTNGTLSANVRFQFRDETVAEVVADTQRVR